MRGKVQCDLHGQIISGITPAYAGKSRRRPPAECPDQDHPRLCGEKRRFPNVVSHIRGSPPPMRGKVRTVSTPTVQQRITPAYAGKSDIYSPAKYPALDHPRLCGEKG